MEQRYSVSSNRMNHSSKVITYSRDEHETAINSTSSWRDATLTRAWRERPVSLTRGWNACVHIVVLLFFVYVYTISFRDLRWKLLGCDMTFCLWILKKRKIKMIAAHAWWKIILMTYHWFLWRLSNFLLYISHIFGMNTCKPLKEDWDS